MYSFDVTRVPSCSMFGRMKQKNGWERLDVRSIDRNLFVFVIAGQATFSLEQQHRILHAGDVLIIPAHTSYRAYTEDFCEYFFCHFTGQLQKTPDPSFAPVFRSFSFDLPVLSDPCIYFPAQMELEQDFQRVYGSVIACAEYQARGSSTGQRLLECEFLKILLLLSDITERKSCSDTLPTPLSKMMIYIKKNLTSPLRGPDISANCGISASYAARLFRKHLNTTITEYINSEKLYYACELMRNTGLSMSEIAEYLGYCDVYYFSRRFKRKFGKSPTQMLIQKQD